MAEISGKITTTDRLTECVACGQDIMADFIVELRPGSLTFVEVDNDLHQVALQGKVTAVRVNHDCAPKQQVKRVRNRRPSPTEATGPKPVGEKVSPGSIDPEEHRRQLRERAIAATPRVGVNESES